MTKIKRRTVLKSIAAASVLSQFPLYGYKSAFAASKRLVYGSAGTVTSSFDPTSHTVAPQIVFEGFTHSKLTNCPMTSSNPSEVLPYRFTMVNHFLLRMLKQLWNMVVIQRDLHLHGIQEN